MTEIKWIYKTACVEASKKLDSYDAVKDFAILLQDELMIHFEDWEVIE